jgi:hypothetical protein
MFFLNFLYRDRWHNGTNDDYGMYFNDLLCATNVPPLVYASDILGFLEFIYE